jgi:hypothetical protein
MRKMAPRKIFFVLSLFISMLSLAAGYVIAGLWIGAVIAIITGLAWLPSRKYPRSLLPHTCLFASVCLAVVGRLTGSPPLLMICGSGAALAVWDLLFLDDALKSSSYGGQTRRHENNHLQSLALALGCGLMVAFVGRLINFQIPFIILMLFVILAVFGLDRVWGYIKKRSMHIS